MPTAAANGVTIPRDSAKGFPRPRREPQIPTATRYEKVTSVRAVVTALDSGDFLDAAHLVEQMLQNPRLRGVLETRLNGLMGTAIRWEPARQNEAGRRAARDIETDWPLICDEPTRKQLHQWGLMLGVGFAQRHWYRSPRTGRAIPRLQVYHPQFARWSWSEARCYQIFTDDEGYVDVDSPSLTAPISPGADLWVVHEPFGQHSWRWGLIHASWYAWLAHEWSRRDMARAGEKLGLGIVKAYFPTPGSDQQKAGVQTYVDGFKTLGSEGVLPCEIFITSDGQVIKMDAEPLEFSGNGIEIIHRGKDSNAVDLAILFLGHNLTTEAKGGSYAAANVGDLIRGDIKAFDAAAEKATIRAQVLASWAERNYGDPDLAPIPVYETDPPAVNQASAQTLYALGQALEKLERFGVDINAMAQRYRLPIKVAERPAATAPPDAPLPEPAPAAVDSAPAAEPAPAAEVEVQINVTPTDEATAIKVDEFRRVRGLPPEGGDVGARWLAEHAVKIRESAGLPPEPGAASEPMPEDAA